jgi:hypothetical protein
LRYDPKGSARQRKCSVFQYFDDFGSPLDRWPGLGEENGPGLGNGIDSAENFVTYETRVGIDERAKILNVSNLRRVAEADFPATNIMSQIRESCVGCEANQYTEQYFHHHFHFLAATLFLAQVYLFKGSTGSNHRPEITVLVIV